MFLRQHLLEEGLVQTKDTRLYINTWFPSLWVCGPLLFFTLTNDLEETKRSEDLFGSQFQRACSVVMGKAERRHIHVHCRVTSA